jgi:hypothetical protein
MSWLTKVLQAGHAKESPDTQTLHFWQRIMSDTHTRGSKFTPKNFSTPFGGEKLVSISETNSKEGTRIHYVGISIERI